MLIKREIEKRLIQSALKYPIVALTGPRQSGKTTLVKNIFNKYQYVSLEDLDNRIFAEKDPRGFLQTYDRPSIIDEVQKVPDLFSYLQTTVDKKGKPGQYILTGSQNFLLHQGISQSLAGRVAIHKLLPLSLSELKKTQYSFDKVEDYIYYGGYPSIFKNKINPSDWYPNYIETYVERDVRNIKQIADLSLFRNFVKLCAGRIGQIINLSDLARDTGISHNTAKAWLSVLETSFIIFFLPPYFKNFNKRIVKSPKLYFYDTGLACSLLGISKKYQLTTHYLKGNLFENLIVGEFIKNKFHRRLQADYYFWRDKAGREIDLLEIINGIIRPIEIKSAETIASDFFDNILFWQKLTKNTTKGMLIYSGSEHQKRTKVEIISWRMI